MRIKILLSLVLVAVVCGWVFRARLLPPRVEVVEAWRGPAVQAVYATGIVEPTVMVPIAARAVGRLVELNADEGREVAAGEVLGRLEDTDLLNTIEELKARAEFARLDYERNVKLRASRAIPEQVLEKSKSDWEAAQAAVGRAEAQADYMKLIAPEAGKIIRRDGEIGQMISANQPVFWLSCCAPLRITSDVDEEDIPLVESGQKVLIQTDAFPGQVFDGFVQSITPKGDPVTRSFRVRIGFGEHLPLLIGMTAETNIITRESNDALLVPSSAVHNGVVEIVKGGRIELRQVKSGVRGLEQTEILSGLEVGEKVVVNGQQDLSEGDRVRAFQR